ncbi:hypothetical protein [Prevotella ihumii]|uniref:hypothetical protein n=1 Tax=Prevotella ihumii TaxID=1917878 RepID=UPI0012B547F3|nr:hypothetical protein [Prevotella ihumii]
MSIYVELLFILNPTRSSDQSDQSDKSDWSDWSDLSDWSDWSDDRVGLNRLLL